MTLHQSACSSPDAATVVFTNLALERLLNTWLRESASGLDPVEGETCEIPLGADTLLVPCLRNSPGGFHDWGLPVLLRDAGGRTADLSDPAELACRMVDVISREATAVGEAARLRLLDGLRRAKEHAHACAARVTDLTPSGLEQSLWHGHPFHPFAKSIEGFSEADLESYAPERGTAFRLCWLIANPDLAETIWRDPASEAWVNSALADLSGLPAEITEGLVLIPSHPWQARQLASDPAFAALVAEGRLSITSITPPSGAPVRPTSSVRTVFAPKQNLFLKLPLAARITNFARTNSREHLARSMAASQALALASEAVTACGLDILSEPAALLINRPELDAVTGVLVREGPARDAFVIAGLLERSPRDGLPIMSSMDCAPSDEQQAVAWVRAYAQAAILPPLRLFARTGISLEAHAQNSLLAFEGGLPARLIVRDLEGVSIDGDRFRLLGPCLKLDPAVLYPSEEAWKRLLYYLIVNQVAHVIATLARMARVAESKLWRVVAEAIASSQEDGETAALVRRLLSLESLPAKANFASCLAGRGERPAYVAIANPLRMSGDAGEAWAWKAAGDRVACQLLGALLNEDLLPEAVASFDGLSEQTDRVVIHSNGSPTYRARARRMQAYGRILIESGSLCDQDGPVVNASAFLADLLPNLPGSPEDHSVFAEELARTEANHAAALAHAAGRPLRDLPYEALESALTDGHRYHPCFKSRIGFTPADNIAYGPEFGNALRPIWIAVHRSIAAANAIGMDSRQDETLVAKSLDPRTRAAFAARIAAHDRRTEDFFLLPVHPWQWKQVANGAMEAEQRDGRLILLGPSPHDYSAQQSIRTLADRTAPEAPTLKLSLSIRNTSTARTLAPHTVLNASVISAWLAEMAADDPYLRSSGTLLLAERMGVAVTHIPAWDRAGITQGALSAIWRDPVTPLLGEGERAVPFAALTHWDGSKGPFIAAWIAKYGVQTWLERLLTVAMLPVVHFLVAKGIALESHQQNMVLFHRDGWPTRVALKDFHDGIRFVPALVGHRPRLVPTPPEHARVNPNSYVEAREVDDVRDFMLDALFGVNLSELGFCLDLWFGYPEARFWERIVATLADHCAAHPVDREGAVRYRLAADTILVEDLARRRIDPANAQGRHVANPLAPLARALG